MGVGQTFSIFLIIIVATASAQTTTTAAPTSAATTGAPKTTSSMTAAPATAAPTTAPTTATPITVALTKARVSFRSVQDTFTADLQNPSSQAFQTRASQIVRELTPIFQREFSSFRFMEVVAFSNGSVITFADLSFVSTSVPNNTQIANVVIEAASVVTGFDIESSSVNVNGEFSSGVSNKFCIITAFCMVLLSWLLSSQQ